MNAQERDQLQQFLATLRQQRVQAKDPVADGLIRDALASQTDATYLLVQRAMALSLALQATQNRLQQLQAASAAALQASNPEQATEAPKAVANAAPSQAPAPLVNGAAHTAPPSLWMRGLVGQVGGTALGVATGVVAGGVLLQGLQALWGDDAASPASILGSAAADSLSTPTEGDGLWDLGDDWT
jgi:uncharacterized protein